MATMTIAANIWSLPLTLLALVVAVAYKLDIFPAIVSPLARIPNAHWSSPFSSLWIDHKRLIKRSANLAIHEAHKRFGPVIRVGPNEVSVNCVDGGLRTIYAGGYEKQQWYDIFQNYGVAPMFAMDDRTAHSKRKRMVSNLYGKSFLQSSRPLAAISDIILEKRLLPVLDKLEAEGQPVEFTDVLSSITMDFVCAYTMGLKNGTNFLGDLKHAHFFNHVFHELQKDSAWPQELPTFSKIMTLLRLDWLFYLDIPDADKYGVEDMVMDMCDRAELTVQRLQDKPDSMLPPEDYPTVYMQLRAGLLKELKATMPDVKDLEAIKLLRNDIASELLDHTMAGYDTSSITLAYLSWQLSKRENVHWQDRLHNELAGITTDPRTIDSYPVLHAIIMETLRLNTAIPGNQPRVTPANAVLGPPGHIYAGLPAGVRVQAQAYSLHRNPEVFPDPETWQPQRWLDADEEHRKEMNRWFWAFGSGGRMCVGSNLAMLELKAVVKTIWTKYTTQVVFDGGMIHHDGYVAPPVGKDGKTLLLQITRRH